MFDHPKSHFISDHVPATWDLFVVPEGIEDYFNEVAFVGSWGRQSFGSEKVTRRVDVVSDGVVPD